MKLRILLLKCREATGHVSRFQGSWCQLRVAYMSSLRSKEVEVIDLTADSPPSSPSPSQADDKGSHRKAEIPNQENKPDTKGQSNCGFGRTLNARESNQANMPKPLGPLKQSGQTMIRHFKRVNKPVQTLGEGPIAPGCKQNIETQPKAEVENAPKKSKSDPYSEQGSSRFGRREWELTPFGSEYRSRGHEGLPFSLMSYNVLAQELLHDNQYLYRDHSNQVLDWEYRKQKLLQEFDYHQPDIICLQEVQQTHLEEFYKPHLEAMGYGGAFLQRTGGKVDGCGTFYKKGKFRVEDVRQVNYFQQGSKLTDRDNVGLILKLAPLSGEEGFCVANTHLLYNPKRGDIKLLQLVKLLAELNHMVPDFQSVPVILCGDFNARPHSFMYKFISQGYLRYHGLPLEDISAQRFGGRRQILNTGLIPTNLNISDQCQYLEHYHLENLRKSPVLGGQFYSYQSSPYHHYNFPHVSQNSGFLWHKFHLVSTYKHFIERTGQPEVTTQSNTSDSSIVDYIFYSVQSRECKSRRGNFNNRNVAEGRMKLLGRWGLLSKNEISSAGNLPNYENPSDHLPLMVKFLLTR